MRKTRRLGDITESGDAILNMHLLTSEKRRKQMFKRYRRSIGVQDSPLFYQSLGRAYRSHDKRSLLTINPALFSEGFNTPIHPRVFRLVDLSIA